MWSSLNEKLSAANVSVSRLAIKLQKLCHRSTVNKNREILNLKLNTGVCPEGGREVALVTSEIWVANPSTAWLAICSVIDVTLVQNISSTSIFEHAVQFVFDDLNK